MDFLQWLDKYFGLATPLAQQAQETGLSPDKILEWAKYAQQKSYEHLLTNGQMMTKEQLAAAWSADHPPVIQVQTGYGTVSQPVGVYFGPLLAEIDKLLAKHLGH